MPPEVPQRPPGTVPLRRYRNPATGLAVYRVDGPGAEGYQREPTPVAYVWPNPLRLDLPVLDYLAEREGPREPAPCAAEPAGCACAVGSRAEGGAGPLAAALLLALAGARRLVRRR